MLTLHHLPIARIDLQTTQELCIHYLDMELFVSLQIHHVIYQAFQPNIFLSICCMVRVLINRALALFYLGCQFVIISGSIQLGFYLETLWMPIFSNGQVVKIFMYSTSHLQKSFLTHMHKNCFLIQSIGDNSRHVKLTIQLLNLLG